MRYNHADSENNYFKNKIDKLSQDKCILTYLAREQGISRATLAEWLDCGPDWITRMTQRGRILVNQKIKISTTDKGGDENAATNSNHTSVGEHQ